MRRGGRRRGARPRRGRGRADDDDDDVAAAAAAEAFDAPDGHDTFEGAVARRARIEDETARAARRRRRRRRRPRRPVASKPRRCIGHPAAATAKTDGAPAAPVVAEVADSTDFFELD